MQYIISDLIKNYSQLEKEEFTYYQFINNEMID